ncbi:unnamed protein product [Meloidogyne enterolobii]|uniref:Uncharacterized protein n=1 Tax=Meloidogyne enterolobii TaxID=390850 RepID=A0ACB1AW84_MELEN
MSTATSSNSPSPPSFLSVSLSQPFDFQAAKVYTESVQWAGIWVATLYVIAIFGIQWFMKERKPLQISLSLQLWNAWLALFRLEKNLKLKLENKNNLKLIFKLI